MHKPLCFMTLLMDQWCRIEPELRTNNSPCLHQSADRQKYLKVANQENSCDCSLTQELLINGSPTGYIINPKPQLIFVSNGQKQPKIYLIIIGLPDACSQSFLKKGAKVIEPLRNKLGKKLLPFTPSTLY